jgi:CDP-paratose 2-epimerase
MRILITGGLGFLGSNLACDAIVKNNTVAVFDNFLRNGSRHNHIWLNEQGEYEFIHGDIRNSNDVSNAIKIFKPDVIYHLAGQVAMTTSIANPRLDFEINTIGTFNLLEEVRKQCPACIVIYSSTNKVYGDLEQYEYEENKYRYICQDFPEGFSEKTLLSFHSPYGCSKGAADQYMRDYSRIFDLNTIVFRHSSMYGGRQFATYDQGWIGWFCQKAIESKLGILKEKITVSGTGKQVRDVLHADDMKNLYSLATKNIQNAKGQAFNIGGGHTNSLSLIELFNLLEEILDIKLNYQLIDARESDQKVFIADVKKAKNLLNWQPEVSHKEGIKRMVDWLLASVYDSK